MNESSAGYLRKKCTYDGLPLHRSKYYYRLDLQITVGKEPALAGLLHVYKSYFPDLILAPLTLTTQTIFKCPDQTTAEAIAALQTKWNHHSANPSFALNGSKDPISRSGVWCNR
jgi:hypothetical protein